MRGQGGQRGQGFGGMMGGFGGMMGGMNFDQNEMMVRMITSAGVLEDLGLEPALREKIQFGLREIDNEQVEIQAGIQRLQQQEADLMLALLTNREDDGTELKALIDQIALNRAEISKLPVKSLIFLRDQLTDDQLAKLIEIYKERQEQMRQRQEQFNNRGRRNGQPQPPPADPAPAAPEAPAADQPAPAAEE